MAFFHLCNISKIRNNLSHSDTEKLIHAFVPSRLRYCNAIVAGCTNNSIKILQLIQNAAARDLTGAAKRDHIAPVLASLLWLPLQFKIELKILLMTYEALNALAPYYVFVYSFISFYLLLFYVLFYSAKHFEIHLCLTGSVQNKIEIETEFPSTLTRLEILLISLCIQ